MRAKLVFIISILTTMSACGDNPGWNETLRRSAPPNPYVATRQEQQSLERQGKAKRESESAKPAVTQAPAPREEVAVTAVRLTLEGFPNCYKGSVRLYVDGKFAALFGKQGSLLQQLTAGEHRLIVWDSSSRWQTSVSVGDGQTVEVTVPCQGREPLNIEQG